MMFIQATELTRSIIETMVNLLADMNIRTILSHQDLTLVLYQEKKKYLIEEQMLHHNKKQQYKLVCHQAEHFVENQKSLLE